MCALFIGGGDADQLSKFPPRDMSGNEMRKDTWMNLEDYPELTARMKVMKSAVFSGTLSPPKHTSGQVPTLTTKK